MFLSIIIIKLQREQMLEAQEMFRTANKVTRPEKALILGFMAGSRGKFMSLTMFISHFIDYISIILLIKLLYVFR